MLDLCVAVAQMDWRLNGDVGLSASQNLCEILDKGFCCQYKFHK